MSARGDDMTAITDKPSVGPCPFCRESLGPVRGFLSKTGPALYAYEPCGCPVQFDAKGYPHPPRKNARNPS